MVCGKETATFWDVDYTPDELVPLGKKIIVSSMYSWPMFDKLLQEREELKKKWIRFHAGM